MNYCRKCRNQLNKTDSFCSKCGEKVNLSFKQELISLVSNSWNSISDTNKKIIFHIILLFFTGGIGNIAYFIYEYIFYKSEKFLNIKKSIEKNTIECNELNAHIEELKRAYIDFKQIDYGEANYSDNSKFNYKRPTLQSQINNYNVYNCSLSVCKNAQQQPFICKYFNIPITEESLSKFESVLNDFSAAEQGKHLLKNERNKIVEGIIDKIPFLIKNFSKEKLIKNLGFKDINFSQLYFPKFIFQYVSAGGNAGTKCEIVMNLDNLERFINYLASVIKFKKSVAGQRTLMTSALRTKIKERDNYTCKVCENSSKIEPNLLK